MYCSGRSAAFLNDEIKYFIEEEHKQNYDLSVQLHLNAFNGSAYGCETYCYNANGLPEAQRISAKLGTVWHDRGAEELQVCTGPERPSKSCPGRIFLL